uniref:Zinc finger PHD-type domain-containing protein n=1 Tax=Anopheles culicifacies TaxID=139723 RepID=A0A182M9H3_9DIPT
MLRSPVEVRYDDAVVLIQTDTDEPARNNDGGNGTTEVPPNATRGSQGNVTGTPESRRFIIRDTHGIEGCGSITIVTPTNNLKISINTKHRIDRQQGFQATKRNLTNDLRNKLGELDELLKASCDAEDDGIDRHSSSSDKRTSAATVETQLNAASTTEGPQDTTTPSTSAKEPSEKNNGACSSEAELVEPLCLLDDVLVQITNDNELYLGTVIDIEPNGHCLARFEDSSCRRVAPADIRRSYSSQRQLRSMSRSLSLPCTEPVVSASLPPRLLRFPPEFFPVVDCCQLPYDLKALKWDAHHRINATGNYCYCGDDGDWAREMIQCRRCEQWFHGRCVRSLQFPILHGDTYYVFICSICNHGHEFVRRLVVSMGNLVHLVLYNLIMRNGCRFYGLRSAILPYIDDNLRTLQLSEKFVKLSSNERADLLLNALKGNKDRFCNGKDYALSAQMWTLRLLQPPPTEPIAIPIPAEETITESKLQQKLENSDQFRILPRAFHEKNYFTDGATRERMLGLAYANHPESVEDPRTQLSAMASATFTLQQSNTIERAVDAAAAATPSQAPSPVPLPPPPPPPPVASSGKRLVGASRRKRRGIRPTPIALPMLSSGLDSIIPPPADFNGANNPFYEEESSASSTGTGRMRPINRKNCAMKRRAFDNNQRLSMKRRKLEYSGSSSSERRVVSRTHAVRKRALSVVVEESSNTLTCYNVKRYNIEQNRNVRTAHPWRSSTTCSSSSCIGEQVDATVVAADRAAVAAADSNSSSVKTKPFASGRRSSGRLLKLPARNYSDTRRRKKRRRDSASEEQWNSGGGELHCHCMGPGSGRNAENTETNELTGDRTSTITALLSSSSTSRKAFWYTPDASTDLGEYVVIGKRTHPNGQKDYLVEPIDRR